MPYISQAKRTSAKPGSPLTIKIGLTWEYSYRPVQPVQELRRNQKERMIKKKARPLMRPGQFTGTGY
jgi:hypothetical protein